MCDNLAFDASDDPSVVVRAHHHHYHEREPRSISETIIASRMADAAAAAVVLAATSSMMVGTGRGGCPSDDGDGGTATPIAVSAAAASSSSSSTLTVVSSAYDTAGDEVHEEEEGGEEEDAGAVQDKEKDSPPPPAATARVDLRFKEMFRGMSMSDVAFKEKFTPRLRVGVCCNAFDTVSLALDSLNVAHALTFICERDTTTRINSMRNFRPAKIVFGMDSLVDDPKRLAVDLFIVRVPRFKWYVNIPETTVDGTGPFYYEPTVLDHALAYIDAVKPAFVVLESDALVSKNRISFRLTEERFHKMGYAVRVTHYRSGDYIHQPALSMSGLDEEIGIRLHPVTEDRVLVCAVLKSNYCSAASSSSSHKEDGGDDGEPLCVDLPTPPPLDDTPTLLARMLARTSRLFGNAAARVSPEGAGSDEERKRWWERLGRAWCCASLSRRGSVADGSHGYGADSDDSVWDDCVEDDGVPALVKMKRRLSVWSRRGSNKSDSNSSGPVSPATTTTTTPAATPSACFEQQNKELSVNSLRRCRGVDLTQVQDEEQLVARLTCPRSKVLLARYGVGSREYLSTCSYLELEKVLSNSIPVRLLEQLFRQLLRCAVYEGGDVERTTDWQGMAAEVFGCRGSEAC